MAAIATAAVLIPLVALATLFCCWRRRKRQEGELKGPSAAVAAAAAGTASRGYGRDGEFSPFLLPWFSRPLVLVIFAVGGGGGGAVLCLTVQQGLRCRPDLADGPSFLFWS